MNVVSTKYGRMQIIDADKVVSQTLSLYGEWAMDELNLLSNLILPGMCVLDVGAFIGTHSLAFSTFVGVHGKVYSFEPRKEIFTVLSENLALNNCCNVSAMNIGLSDTEQNLELQAIDLNDAVNFGGLALDNAPESTTFEHYQVHVTTIDRLKLNKIDLIKLDVEGMERRVLDGAVCTLVRDRPVIFCECNSIFSGNEIINFCEEQHYDVFGFLTSAYNPDNFNGVKENIWGDAKELSLLLVAKEKSAAVNLLANKTIFQIITIEDLVLPLLHKPQYAHEILANTSAKSLLGINYPSPGSSVLDTKIAMLAGTINSLESAVFSANQQADALRNELRLLHLSSSWRITKPMRWVSGKFKTIKRLVELVGNHQKNYPGITGYKRLADVCVNALRSGAISGLKSKIAEYERLTQEKGVQDIVVQQISVAPPIEDLLVLINNGAIIKPTIIFDHNGGGGANTYTSELTKSIIEGGGMVLRVYSINANWFLQWINADGDLLFKTNSIELLFDVLAASKSDSVVLNSVYGYSDIAVTAQKIGELLERLSAVFDFKVHDFYALCPSPHLSDFEEKYCGVPENPDVCKKCLKNNSSWYHSWYPIENRPSEITAWRKPFKKLLDLATTVTFFDSSAVEILRKGFFIDDNKINVIPHTASHFVFNERMDITGPIHIGVLGTLSHIKGGNEVKALCEYIEAQGFGVPVTIVGRSYIDLPPKVEVSGAYVTSDLPEIIRAKGINIIYMPSIIPETFSYTLSETIQMKLPVVAFDLGAQGNRVKQYDFGQVVPLGSTPEVVLAAIKSAFRAAQEFKI